jgi:hypothetical protein
LLCGTHLLQLCAFGTVTAAVRCRCRTLR